MTEEPQVIVEEEPPRQPRYLTNTALLSQVADNVDFDITPDQVGNILATYWALNEGDPIGTIRRDPDTGAVAVRVEDNGMHLWRVNQPDGHSYNDLQPKLPWPVVS